jgi:hypothetical protein
MKDLMKINVIFLGALLFGFAFMGPNAQGNMMGPHQNQPAPYSSGSNGGMSSGFHMPGTYNMNSMMDELYPELLQIWPNGSMWQGDDGAIQIQPEPQGPVYTYFFLTEGWSSSQGTGPYMHFDNAGFYAVTSTGTYSGHPAPYDPNAFVDMIQSIMGSSVDINYTSDGAITIPLPGGNQWVCLGASAEAVDLPGVDSGISVMQPGSMFSDVMFNYGAGYQQGFHPSFMHASEIMNALSNLSGIGDVQLGANGVITGVLHDGASAHAIALYPGMIYETGTSQAGTGFGYNAQAGWWFDYSGGEHQPFMVYVDGNLI